MSEYPQPKIPGPFQCSGCYEGVHVTDVDGDEDDPQSAHTSDGDATCPNCGARFADGWAGALGEKVAHVQLTGAAGPEDAFMMGVNLTENQPAGAFGYEREGDHVSVFKKLIPTED